MIVFTLTFLFLDIKYHSMVIGADRRQEQEGM